MRLRESAHESNHGWNPAPDAPVLDEEEVHVWRIPLSLPDALLGWATALLDDAERARAARFQLDRDRVRFAVGRAIQRDILARYLRVEPHNVRYCMNPSGKPELVPGDGLQDLRFNFSNSADLGLVAVASGRAVGIDVERLRPVPDAVQLAADWLSPGERSVLDAASPEHRATTFLRCWTYKEAYLKALGTGMSLPLDVDYDDVVFAPTDETIRMLGIAPRSCSSETPRWKLEAPAPAAGYVGALAVEGLAWRRSQFEWASAGGTSAANPLSDHPRAI